MEMDEMCTFLSISCLSLPELCTGSWFDLWVTGKYRWCADKAYTRNTIKIMTDKRMVTISSLQDMWNIFNPHSFTQAEQMTHCTWFAVHRLLNLRFVISCARDSRCLAGVHQILIIKVTPVIPFISEVKADGRYLWGWSIFALSAMVWCCGRAFWANWAVGLDLASIHLMILTHAGRKSWVRPHCRTQTKQHSFFEF